MVGLVKRVFILYDVCVGNCVDVVDELFYEVWMKKVGIWMERKVLLMKKVLIVGVGLGGLVVGVFF